MLRIAICDDEIKDIDIASELTKNLLNSLDLEYEIETFFDGSHLLKSTTVYDLILLDIEMKEISGIEVARKLRMYNSDAKIMFITNSSDYLRIGYTVKADRYFIKPIDKMEFNYEVANTLKERIIDNEYILDKRISPYKIYLKRILYVEFFNRKTVVHMYDISIATSLTLKEWLAILGNHYFSQCHRAFIVNLRQIKELKTDFLMVSNGKELLLSRKFKEQFRKDYFNFIGERI